MEIVETEIDGVKLIKPLIFGDSRGFFLESYNKKTLNALGIEEDFVQDNHSRSQKGVLRGLHYQTTQPQGKLVRVVEGEVFDVVVDLREDSKTFGKWVGVFLSEENKHLLWMPKGCAHGFLVLSSYATFLYKTTDYYHPQSEKTLLWNDETVGIKWPLERLEGQKPLLSMKDLAADTWQNSLKFSASLEKGLRALPV